jgi:hypothetical protein
MPEIIDPVFAKTSQNARFLLSENERFGLVFVKTGSINSGTRKFQILNNLPRHDRMGNKSISRYFPLNMFNGISLFPYSHF